MWSMVIGIYWVYVLFNCVVISRLVLYIKYICSMFKMYFFYKNLILGVCFLIFFLFVFFSFIDMIFMVIGILGDVILIICVRKYVFCF